MPQLSIEPETASVSPSAAPSNGPINGFPASSTTGDDQSVPPSVGTIATRTIGVAAGSSPASVPSIVVSSGPTGPSDWLPDQAETADSSPRSAAPQTAQAVAGISSGRAGGQTAQQAPTGLPEVAATSSATVFAPGVAPAIAIVRVAVGRRNEPSPGSTRRFMFASLSVSLPSALQPMPKEFTPPAPPLPLDMMIWIGYQPVVSFVNFLGPLSP